MKQHNIVVTVNIKCFFCYNTGLQSLWKLLLLCLTDPELGFYLQHFVEFGDYLRTVACDTFSQTWHSRGFNSGELRGHISLAMRSEVLSVFQSGMAVVCVV